MDETLSELDRVFRDLLARNKGPEYGVKVLSAAPGLSSIDVELRFVAGRRYCCIQPGCHLPLTIDMVFWEAAGHGVRLPADAVVHWHCRVEEGAEAEANRLFDMPYECEAQEFDHTTPASWTAP